MKKVSDCARGFLTQSAHKMAGQGQKKGDWNVVCFIAEDFSVPLLIVSGGVGRVLFLLIPGPSGTMCSYVPVFCSISIILTILHKYIEL